MFAPSHYITSYFSCTKLTGLAVAALCASPLPSAAQVPTGTLCAATGMSVLAQPARQTTSAVFNDMGRFVFTQGKTGCVLVNVTGEFVTTNNAAIFMRALLDSTTPSPISEIVFNMTETETRSVAFLFQNVAPGKHTVRVQWRTDDPGESVGTGDTVMWVNFIP